MSSSVAAQSQSQSVTPPKGTRRVAVTVLLVVMLVAAAAFGATLIMAGGIQGVSDLLFGTASAQSSTAVVKTPKGGAPAGTSPTATAGSAATSGSAAATGTVKQPSSTAKGAAAVSGPSAIRMFNEQAGSQGAILKLVNNGISSMSFGTPSVGSRTARVPVRAALRSGGGAGATMVMTKSGANWYFTSLGDVNGSAGLPFDSGLVSALIRAQSEPGAQDAASALLAGEIKSLKVTGVSRGSGTASVNCVITGSGEYAGRRCRFTCIKKTDGATDYWFISRFSWS